MTLFHIVHDSNKKKVYTSYLNAIKSGAIIDPDKDKGVFAVRIDHNIVNF